MKKYVIEINPSKNNQVYARILFRNGKVFMHTETYKNKNFLLTKIKELVGSLSFDTVVIKDNKDIIWD